MKTTRSGLRRVAALCTAVVLCGCAARTAEHFYSVSVPVAASTIATEAPRVAVAPIVIPSMIDRPQLVVRTSEHELDVLESHRWAEPLSVDLTRTLVDELRRSRGGSEIAEQDAPLARLAPLVLEVTVAELVAGPGQSVSLQASWVLRDRQRTCVSVGRFGASIPMQAGYGAIPTGYAAAMARLADPIARTIGDSASCASAEIAKLANS